jgi:RHS repeat-associated protein
VALTNSSGLVASRYAYTAYGEQTLLNFTGAAQDFSTYGNRYSYTGREWDNDLKLHYFRARWYDADAGRFMGRDPLGFVDGMSLYRGYFANSMLDPYGFNTTFFKPRPNQGTKNCKAKCHF